jgi:predicted CXXCH cytochrome family protein
MAVRPAAVMPCARLCFAALILCASGIAAGTDCPPAGSAHVIDEAKHGMGPRHHPVGRPLPDVETFNQPGRCAEDIWLYDLNGNGRVDAGEPRLFGPQRVVDCGSCHGESADAKSPQSASVFLRQDAATLCLVCHRL